MVMVMAMRQVHAVVVVESSGGVTLTARTGRQLRVVLRRWTSGGDECGESCGGRGCAGDPRGLPTIGGTSPAPGWLVSSLDMETSHEEVRNNWAWKVQSQ